jgi:hypothetical protein
MATGPTRSDLPHRPPREGEGRRDARLAELVAELASCDTDLALDAVGDGAEGADPLELVARAMTSIRHRTLEPQDRLRVAGFLRPGLAPLPRRVPAATLVADPPEQAEDHLVHHGSLRRWERTDATDPDHRHDGAVDPDDVVIDLRDRTARFRRPGYA